MRGRRIAARRSVPASLALVAALACAGGGSKVPGVPGFGILSGKTVLVLPVQYVRRGPGGWVGGASNAQAAARGADVEIAFALAEQGGRATWVLPDEQVELLRRRPMIQVDPYALSADKTRAAGRNQRRIRDPLYGEIRALAALFDSRYVVWPLEVYYEQKGGEPGGRVAIRTLLLDARAGDILWQGVVRGADLPYTSPGALASAAQAFALRASP